MIDPARRLALARRRFARAFDTELPGAALGDIQLRPSQRAAAARITKLLRRCGGALLADPVGVGKTYVALAAAREHRRVTVVAPAALRTMWESALEHARVDARLLSYERLSRDGRAKPGGDLVILDEGHHLRTTTTRRYAAAVDLCRGACVLVLSATPVQNRFADLAAQLALFLGTRAFALRESELLEHVVRGAGGTEAPGMPDVDGPHEVAIGPDDDCLDLLLALPPPVPAVDEGDAGVLVTFSLVQQWASSRAALLAALRRRHARASALAMILESGRMPSRADLAAWTAADDTVQVAFPELLVDRAGDTAQLLAAVRLHEDAVRSAIRDLSSASTSIDVARADALRRIRAAHPGQRVIAFSQFAETVHALARLLVRDGRVACVTSRGGRIAGGTIPRREVLAQLAPGAAAASRATRIDLLLTTDVLSEGLNLQQASVVVHLDLPWNPARLEQRVGRVRRLGSPYGTVTVYAFQPPASAERLLRLRQRLEAKLAAAQAAVGIAVPVLPGGDLPPAQSLGAAQAAGLVRALLARWQAADASDAADTPDLAGASDSHRAIVAAVRAAHFGFVALVCPSGNDPLLVACLSHESEHPTTDPAVVWRALECCEGPAAEPRGPAVRGAARALVQWWTSRRAAAAVGLRTSATVPVRHAALARLRAITRRTPRHRRESLAELAARAQGVLAMPMSPADEEDLATLAAEPLSDERWLEAVCSFGHHTSWPAELPASSAVEPPVRAIILLQPDTIVGRAANLEHGPRVNHSALDQYGQTPLAPALPAITTSAGEPCTDARFRTPGCSHVPPPSHSPPARSTSPPPRAPAPSPAA